MLILLFPIGDVLTFGHPRGADIGPGTRVRQSNSEFQFIFGFCNCGSFSGAESSVPGSTIGLPNAAPRSTLASVHSSSSFDASLLYSSTPSPYSAVPPSFSFTDSGVGICPSPTHHVAQFSRASEESRENEEEIPPSCAAVPHGDPEILVPDAAVNSTDPAPPLDEPDSPNTDRVSRQDDLATSTEQIVETQIEMDLDRCENVTGPSERTPPSTEDQGFGNVVLEHERGVSAPAITQVAPAEAQEQAVPAVAQEDSAFSSAHLVALLRDRDRQSTEGLSLLNPLLCKRARFLHRTRPGISIRMVSRRWRTGQRLLKKQVQYFYNK